MKIITKYVSTDGVEWSDAASATIRDELNAEVMAIEATLGRPPECGKRTCIDAAAWVKAKLAVVEICRRLWPGEKVFQHAAADIHPMSYAGRFLDDVGGPVRRVWHRFMCANGDFEYDQPFFAMNPDKFEE